MLVYCNNLLSEQEILHDKISKKNYLLIHKNGSTSLEALAKKNSQRYAVHKSEFFNNSTAELEVVVFIRDPIKRFVSGLGTQMAIYQISKEVMSGIINNDKIISFFDLHTTPQFWTLLSLGKKYPIKFKLLPMSEMSSVDEDLEQLNQGSPANIINLTDEATQRLTHFYTEDIVMYNNFLNCTVSIEEIIDRIKLEKNFINDLTQYKQLLTYLF